MWDYAAYLFDWDGTLIQSNEPWLELVHAQLGRYNLRLSDQEIARKIFGRYGIGMRELGVPEADIEKLSHETIAAGRKLLLGAPLYPGAKEILERLKAQGKKAGLITSSYREVIAPAVKERGLEALFDVIVAGDEVRAQKPDPDGILKALALLGVAPVQSIMAGDSPKDLLAAYNAGCDSMLFYPSSHELHHCYDELLACKPVYTIRSWNELLDGRMETDD